MEPQDRYMMTAKFIGLNKHGAVVHGNHLNIGSVSAADQSTERESSQLTQFFKKMLISLSTIEEWVKGKRREDICKAEWLLLAKALDRLLLLIYGTTFVVSTLAILTGHPMFRID